MSAKIDNETFATESKVEEQELRQRTIGRLLKSTREALRLPQSDLARNLGYSSPQFISNWERGISMPPMDQLPKLMSLLKIPPRTLIETLHLYQDELLKIQKRRVVELLRSHSNE